MLASNWVTEQSWWTVPTNQGKWPCGV